MFCKPCQSSSHEEASCWGPCTHCGKRNHKASYCKFKDNNQSNTQTEGADKATTKNKNKKKKKTGKKATINNADPQREDEGKSEEEVSEDDSPRKHNSEEVTQVMARTASIQYGNASSQVPNPF